MEEPNCDCLGGMDRSKRICETVFSVKPLWCCIMCGAVFWDENKLQYAAEAVTRGASTDDFKTIMRMKKNLKMLQEKAPHLHSAISRIVQNKEGVKVPDTKCSGCNANLDRAMVTDSKDPNPKKGDVSVCLHCGEVMEFDEDLKPIPISNSTWAKMPADEKTEVLLTSTRFGEKGAKPRSVH